MKNIPSDLNAIVRMHLAAAEKLRRKKVPIWRNRADTMEAMAINMRKWAKEARS